MIQTNRHERRRADALHGRGFTDEQITLMPDHGAGDPLLDASGTCRYLGNISNMTLWRWTALHGFPAADFVFGRRRFWRLSTVEGWLAQNRAAPAA